MNVTLTYIRPGHAPSDLLPGTEEITLADLMAQLTVPGEQIVITRLP
jgi:hypothetical protein